MSVDPFTRDPQAGSRATDPTVCGQCRLRSTTTTETPDGPRCAACKETA